jgi:hypothetical protein
VEENNGMNSGSLLVENEQFPSDEAGEGGEEGVMPGGVRECEQHNACIRTLFNLYQGGYLNV